MLKFLLIISIISSTVSAQNRFDGLAKTFESGNNNILLSYFYADQIWTGKCLSSDSVEYVAGNNGPRRLRPAVLFNYYFKSEDPFIGTAEVSTQLIAYNSDSPEISWKTFRDQSPSAHGPLSTQTIDGKKTPYLRKTNNLARYYSIVEMNGKKYLMTKDTLLGGYGYWIRYCYFSLKLAGKPWAPEPVIEEDNGDSDKDPSLLKYDVFKLETSKINDISVPPKDLLALLSAGNVEVYVALTDDGIIPLTVPQVKTISSDEVIFGANLNIGPVAIPVSESDLVFGEKNSSFTIGPLNVPPSLLADTTISLGFERVKDETVVELFGNHPKADKLFESEE